MRKLTAQDIINIIGTETHGYKIFGAGIKKGPHTDSDHYGIVLGQNKTGNYVTWQFHLDDEEPNYYWGHYLSDDREAAIRDFNERGADLQEATETEAM